ncbi:5'-flap endonuclease [Bachmanniomyces sp. S44760]|nr:5'-flap endonuclease [Bachmanniomyces sp. S44760]
MLVLSSSPVSTHRTSPRDGVRAARSYSPLPSPSEVVFQRPSGDRFGGASTANSKSHSGFAYASKYFHHSLSSEIAAEPGVQQDASSKKDCETKTKQHTEMSNKGRKSKPLRRLATADHGVAPPPASTSVDIVDAVIMPLQTAGTSRSSAKNTMTQVKMKAGRVTKPASTSRNRKMMPVPESIQDGGAGASEAPPIVDASMDSVNVEAVLNLEKSNARRRSWTPVDDTIVNDTEFRNNIISAPSQDTATSGRNGFMAMLEDYQFNRPTKEPMEERKSLNDFPRDAIRDFVRLEEGSFRHIPLTSTDETQPVKRPAPQLVAPLVQGKKTKAPKKKPQTITFKATEQFIPEKTSVSASLLEYFAGPKAADEHVVSTVDTLNDQRPPKRRRRTETSGNPPKADRSRSKSKKKSRTDALVLAPEVALETARSQDLLFGTSSQLARDESPALLRDIQTAIKLSETTEHPPLLTGEVSGWDTPDSTGSGSSNASSVALLKSSKSLWSVSARDSDGNLLDAEVVDLTNTPKAKCSADKSEKCVAGSETVELRNDAFTDISLLLPQKASKGTTSDIGRDCEPTAEGSLPRSIAEAGLRKRPRSQSPQKKSTKIQAKAVLAASEKPNFNGYTSAHLTKAIASYGFKPIKNREQMIDLMEKCWESKQRLALQPLPSNIGPEKHSRTSTCSDPGKEQSPQTRKGRPPKDKALHDNGKVGAVPKAAPKPRGRPKKIESPPAHPERESDPTSSTPKSVSKRKAPTKKPKPAISPPPDEIEDLDGPSPTPSPPRRRVASPPSKTKAIKPLELELTSSTSSSAPSLPPTNSKDQSHLLPLMTLAVKSCPPTTDPKYPSWYDKILLYDPIVLEDLATWLNTDGLGRIGVDEEVGPALVRRWCEERGVCCLWRENLRGGARSRY